MLNMLREGKDPRNSGCCGEGFTGEVKCQLSIFFQNGSFTREMKNRAGWD